MGRTWRSGVQLASIAGLALLGQASAAAPIRYNCDTPGGAYSEIEQYQRGPDYRVRGSVSPLSLREHPRFVPTATVWLQSEDKKNSAALQLTKGRGRELDVTVISVVDGDRKNRSVGTINVDEELQFDISFPAEGPGVVQAGTKRFDVEMKLGPNARLSVTCSSGVFEFRDLDWDAAADPAERAED